MDTTKSKHIRYEHVKLDHTRCVRAECEGKYHWSIMFEQ